jgi:DNA-binding winged helix-turn-helix (wHTH) protein/Tfp pilus assembly protein PilF
MRNFSETGVRPIDMSQSSARQTDALPRWLRVGPCIVDSDRGALLRDGRPVPLRNQCWKLLAYLMQRPARLVSRDELMTALWPGRVVVDDSLVQCVVELRRALGDDSKRLIRTVSGRGYRLELSDLSLVEPTGDAQAGEPALAQAWEELRRLQSRQAVADARQCFEHQLQIQNEASSLAGLALSHVIDVLQRWSRTPQWQLEIASDAADEAIALDATCALAHHARAHVAMHRGFYFEAQAGFRKALRLAPSLAHAHLRLGIIRLELGHPELAGAHVLQALAAEGTQALRAQAAFVEGMAAFHLGDDCSARRLMQHAIACNPQGGFAYQWLAAIEALHGHEDLAAVHLQAYVERMPGYTIESLQATERSRNPAFWQQRQRLYTGLRRAGLPR